MLCDRILDAQLSVRRINVTANHILAESDLAKTPVADQLDLFSDYEAIARKQAATEQTLMLEKKRQQAMLAIKKKYGKNAILKGSDLQEGATTMLRNNQIGGHKA